MKKKVYCALCGSDNVKKIYGITHPYKGAYTHRCLSCNCDFGKPHLPEAKEDIADYKKAKKREDDKDDPILSLDEFKKEIGLDKPELVDETMGKLIIEQDEPKPEAKEDEIDEILEKLCKSVHELEGQWDDKKLMFGSFHRALYGSIKQARQELAKWLRKQAEQWIGLNASEDVIDALADKVRGK